MKNKSVREIALIDIANETTFHRDENEVTARKIDTKENRTLNKRLGIKNINYKARYEK